MRNPLPIVLVSLFLIIVVIIIPLFGKPLLAGYHQIKGGNILDQVIKTGQNTNSNKWSCEDNTSPDVRQRELIERAITHFEASLRENPEMDQSALLLGRAYCWYMQPEKAVNFFQLYNDLKPKSPIGYIELGFAYESVCRIKSIQDINYDTSANEYLCSDQTLNSLIRSAWSQANLDARDFIDTGYEGLENDDVETSLKYAARALLIDDENPETLYLIGQILAQRKEYTGADGWISEAIDKDPTKVDWYMERANIAESAGNQDLAIEIYRQIVAQFPRMDKAHIHLGNILYEKGYDVQDVISEFDHAIAINPDSGEGYFAAGEVLSQEGRCKEADAYYRQAIDNEPHNNWWYLARGDNLRDCQELERAVGVYEDAVRLFPDYALAYHQLAWAYNLNHQYDKAIDAIEKSQSLFGKDVPDWSYERAAIIYEDSGNIEKAIEALMHILVKNQNNSKIKQEIERLKYLLENQR